MDIAPLLAATRPASTSQLLRVCLDYLDPPVLCVRCPATAGIIYNNTDVKDTTGQ